MILDQMKNASFYKGVLPAIATALEKAAIYTSDNYPGGRVDVDGDNLFLLLNTYETHSPEGALCEAHQKYIDVMYMVEGEEIIYRQDEIWVWEKSHPTLYCSCQNRSSGSNRLER